MTRDDRPALLALLVEHEGVRLKPYRDTVGKLTIGVGRNLDDVGISHDEAMMLLDHDIDRALGGGAATWPWFADLAPARQIVLVDMAFNLGIGGLKRFRRMLAALEAGDHATAAGQMLDSVWAHQVGARARRLAQMMVEGTI